jgi:hypothetical protein
MEVIPGGGWLCPTGKNNLAIEDNLRLLTTINRLNVQLFGTEVTDADIAFLADGDERQVAVQTYPEGYEAAFILDDVDEAVHNDQSLQKIQRTKDGGFKQEHFLASSCLPLPSGAYLSVVQQLDRETISYIQSARDSSGTPRSFASMRPDSETLEMYAMGVIRRSDRLFAAITIYDDPDQRVSKLELWDMRPNNDGKIAVHLDTSDSVQEIAVSGTRTLDRFGLHNIGSHEDRDTSNLILDPSSYESVLNAVARAIGKEAKAWENPDMKLTASGLYKALELPSMDPTDYWISV